MRFIPSDESREERSIELRTIAGAGVPWVCGFAITGIRNWVGFTHLWVFGFYISLIHDHIRHILKQSQFTHMLKNIIINKINIYKNIKVRSGLNIT